MSMFLKVSIALLIGLTLASISLLFLGDFQGRFERVFSTFALFAVFVVLTAIDTSREKRNEWYAPVALIANTYILGLLLIVIWMTPYTSFGLMLEIMWKSILVIVVTRLVIICCEVLLRSGEKTGGVSVIFAFATSVLAIISGILFTAPTGVEAFNVRTTDMYWKVATSVLILTALGLSITLLLRWSGKSDARAARRAAAAAVSGGHPHQAPYTTQEPYIPQAQNPGQPHPHYPQPHAQYPGQHVGHYPQPPVQFPASQQPQMDQVQPHEDQVQSQVEQQQLQQPHTEQQQQPQSPPAEAGELLPWPTFADGRPIPARPDGQPDFSVPGAPLPPTQIPPQA